MNGIICHVNSCLNTSKSTQIYCSAHSERLRLKGDLLESKPVRKLEHHRKTFTSTYRSWDHARQRVSNPRNDQYIHYGGRGISMCEEWMSSFEAFLRDMGERPDGKTLDRIDNEGDYSPENCRWATKFQQSTNKRPAMKNKHGMSGLHFLSGAKLWRVTIQAKGVRTYIGRYETKEDAMKARKEAEIKYWRAE